ncbi:MAG: amidohydrolase family protein [Bacteroidetes bacterium]|nr:amidohydrolase family protein [Bacteroidota bacterium]
MNYKLQVTGCKFFHAVLLFTFSFLIFNSGFSQNPIPAPAQTKSILLMNGIAHIGNGKVIENSAIGFKDGKIILIADATTIRLQSGAYDTTINIQGKHVYPGIIAANSTLGLAEIGAVRATLDYSETGNYNPHVRSVTSYNSDSKIPPTARPNGILIAQITPRGGVVSGTSSILELDGWNWEDMAMKTDDGIHLNWPKMFKRDWEKSEDANEIAPLKKSDDYDKQKNEMKKFFTDAKAYSEIIPSEKNLRLEAMKGVFSEAKTLFIHVSYVKEIEDAVHFAKENGVKKMVIVGGEDSWLVTDLLKENNVAVMLNRVHDLPNRTDDDIDLPYKTPSLLQKAGVLFCLQNAGDMEQIQTRNIPFLAGTAAAYGLTKEEALASVTLNTAKILGIDSKVGSLEEGKDATLFISTGDALDMKSNNVELAFIRGKKLNLSNEQNALYEKYKMKYVIK